MGSSQVSPEPGVKPGMGFARGLTLQGRPSSSRSTGARTGAQRAALASRGKHGRDNALY